MSHMPFDMQKFLKNAQGSMMIGPKDNPNPPGLPCVQRGTPPVVSNSGTESLKAARDQHCCQTSKESPANVSKALHACLEKCITSSESIFQK